jgi:hypothetical protein
MKQIKSLQTTVQSNSLFENMSSKAMMVRQTATKAVLPVLKTIGHTSHPPIPDPHPKNYCMHLYTHPDKYVVMPPALPAPELHQPARQAIVIDRASVEVECLDVDHAQEMMRGKAKVSIVGLLGIARLQHASYLVVVTGRQVVGYMPHGLVYRVTHTAIRVLGPGSKAGISQVPAPCPRLSRHCCLTLHLLGACDIQSVANGWFCHKFLCRWALLSIFLQSLQTHKRLVEKVG